MKKTVLVILLCLFAATAFAKVEIIKTDEGEQAVFDENKRLTVFKDSPIAEGDYICVYLDSSELDSKGHNKLEWYSLDKIDKHYLKIGITKANIRLPSYILEEEEKSEISVPLGGFTTPTGTLAAQGVKIKITVTDPQHISAEIVN
ncbi:MAG: hypothetical protein WBD00_07565 [Candidatus Omnitrophota bacterium]